jgi:hypothetical protein
MRTRIVALACVLAACAANTSMASSSAVAWSSRYVLATSTIDSQLWPVVNAMVEDSALRDHDTCDLLAEALLRLEAQNIRAKYSEGQMVRVLANVANAARYRDVLDKVARSLSDKAAKLQITQYHRKTDRTKADQYIPGSIDLEALQRSFAQAALEAKPSAAQAQALADLPTNASMDDLFVAAGKPALVVSRDVRVADIVTVEVRQFWFYYRGIGRVTYDYQRDSGWHPHGLTADPMAFEGSMPYRARAAELGLPDDSTLAMIQLVSGNASSIKASMQASYRRGDPPQEYLDAAAEMLLQHYVEIANTGANDAYAWICNVLSDHGGPRYAVVLATVERTSSDPKLRKFAGQAVQQRADIPTAQYVAGSISLAEKAKQYPSLYPQITLVRGLL